MLTRLRRALGIVSPSARFREIGAAVAEMIVEVMRAPFACTPRKLAPSCSGRGRQRSPSRRPPYGKRPERR